jgi:RHS repeat-associated protein
LLVARQYYLRDHLGSVRVTINEASQVIHHDDYYPFGLSMPGRSMVTAVPKENFTGHELDDESGFYYAGARYLDPVIGRWNAVDPLAEKHFDWTPYNYVLGNPLRLVDPDGRQVGYHMAQAYRGDWSRMRRDGEIALGAIAVGASLVPAGYVAQGVIGTVADALTGGIGWSSVLNWIPGLGKADEVVGDAARIADKAFDTSRLGGKIIDVPGMGKLDLTLDGVTEFLSNNEKRINQKLGRKIAQGRLPFGVGPDAIGQAKHIINETLGKATHRSPVNLVDGGKAKLIDIFSESTGFTVRINAGTGEFVTLIPEATSWIIK